MIDFSNELLSKCKKISGRIPLHDTRWLTQMGFNQNELEQLQSLPKFAYDEIKGYKIQVKSVDQLHHLEVW